MKYILPGFLLILALYIGAYFAVLSFPPGFRLRRPAGQSVVIETKYLEINGAFIADYHGIPGSFFDPIHALDKKYLRPHYWFTPRDQPTSLDWLLGQMAAEDKAR
jgi:hypothetical protein